MRDHTSYIRAIVALCTSRLLMPIVATGDESMDGPDPDRHAEMAAVTLKDDTGNYLLAFTGADSMRQWSPEARPVLCLLDELCATVAAAGADQLLIDVAGPVPFVIAGRRCSCSPRVTGSSSSRARSSRGSGTPRRREPLFGRTGLDPLDCREFNRRLRLPCKRSHLPPERP
ncbi:SseB family protein [Tessaracoccus sp. HDW20]|nr:SseB family protein [Tessaracoccus coleopterorum]